MTDQLKDNDIVDNSLQNDRTLVSIKNNILMRSMMRVNIYMYMYMYKRVGYISMMQT